MSESVSSASITADLERFVYADVALDPNGVELSVLSALSRRGLDPWDEAQRLAQLPRPAAADGLAQTLKMVPAVQSLRLDVKVVSDRLVALLPDRRSATNATLSSKPGATPVRLPRGLTLVMMAAIFAGMLAPLIMPKPADTVAPASWVTSDAKAQVKPAATVPPSHPQVPAATTPPASVH